MLAGWRPGEFQEPRLIPVRPKDPIFRMTPSKMVTEYKGRTRSKYDVGASYGRLRVVASRPTGWAGGIIYTAQCEVCGKQHDYAGSLLKLAMRHNSPCAGCRRGKARRQVTP
jgi:hypothetical protein